MEKKSDKDLKEKKDSVENCNSDKDNLYTEGYEKKFIIFLDDDGSLKEKVAWIRPENNGWWIKLDPSLKPFWISSTRVLKIKPTSDDKLELRKEGGNND